MARPAKYSPERTKLILAALREGNTRVASAALAGISHATLLRWAERYDDFATHVKEAEAAAERERVASIRRASKAGVWQADAWWLERRRPDEWGKIDRVEITFRQQAERIAQELGCSVEEVITRAEAIANGR